MLSKQLQTEQNVQMDTTPFHTSTSFQRIWHRKIIPTSKIFQNIPTSKVAMIYREEEKAFLRALARPLTFLYFDLYLYSAYATHVYF